MARTLSKPRQTQVSSYDPGTIDAYYRIVAESTNDAISITDLTTGCILYISPSVKRVLGYPASEITGVPHAIFLPPTSLESGTRVLEEQLAYDGTADADKNRSWAIELEAYRQDKSIVWIESRSSFLRDVDGKPTSVITIARDITERKKIEQALRESEERYRTFFEDSREPICMIDDAGRMVDANKAALALFGYASKPCELRPTKAVVPIAELESMRRSFGRRGYVKDRQMTLIRRDGKAMECSATFVCRYDAKGKAARYEGIVRDVTQQKRVQENLESYVSQVTKAQEEERRHISRELHDESIQVLSALSLEILAVSRRKGITVGEALESMERMRGRMNEVAEGLSRLCRALRPSTLEHLGLVPAIGMLLNDLAEVMRVEVALKVSNRERRLPTEVELGLFRIVQEACTNIRKHSGAKTVSVEVVFKRGTVMIRVRDDGSGFVVPRNLGDLSRLNRMGLVGMRERAQSLGGSLRVNSSPGKGTTVLVAMPESHD